LLDARQVNAVNDDLINAVGPLGQRRLHHAAQGGTVRVVGAGAELLVTAADLAAAAHDAAGKGQDHARYLTNGGDGGLRRGESGCLTVADDQEVAASHALDRPEEILADEFAVHHRHPPETP